MAKETNKTEQTVVEQTIAPAEEIVAEVVDNTTSSEEQTAETQAADESTTQEQASTTEEQAADEQTESETSTAAPEEPEAPFDGVPAKGVYAKQIEAGNFTLAKNRWLKTVYVTLDCVAFESKLKAEKHAKTLKDSTVVHVGT